MKLRLQNKKEDEGKSAIISSVAHFRNRSMASAVKAMAERGRWTRGSELIIYNVQNIVSRRSMMSHEGGKSLEEPPLEQEIVKLLNKGLERDFISSATYRRVVKDDPNNDPRLILLAVEKDEVLRVLIGARRTKEPKEVINQHKALFGSKRFQFHLTIGTRRSLKSFIQSSRP